MWTAKGCKAPSVQHPSFSEAPSIKYQFENGWLKHTPCLTQRTQRENKIQTAPLSGLFKWLG